MAPALCKYLFRLFFFLRPLLGSPKSIQLISHEQFRMKSIHGVSIRVDVVVDVVNFDVFFIFNDVFFLFPFSVCNCMQSVSI